MSAVSAGVDEELAKGMAGYHASKEVTRKHSTMANAADAAVKARQAAEGQVMINIAKQVAADVATKKSPKICCQGRQHCRDLCEARQAAEGAGAGFRDCQGRL